jgi:hypothetical protein
VLRRPLEFALTSSVGVEDHPFGRPTLDEGHLDGLFD